jgi:cell division protein FtsI (penicillin-binding protein 3)
VTKHPHPKDTRQCSLFADYAFRGEDRVKECYSYRKKAMRLKLITFMVTFWSLLVVGRLFQLQISQYSEWSVAATRQHVGSFILASERGVIYDRNGRLLATSVPGGSVYVRPRQVRDKEQMAIDLSNLLEVPPETIKARVNASKAPFIWIARQLPRPISDKVEKAKIPGVFVTLESRRYYPYGNAASNVIGAVGIDGNGLSGIEAVFEKHLHVKGFSDTVGRDGFGNILHVSHDRSALPKGAPLSLTIDANIQLIVDEELERGRESAKAALGMAAMIDADSGEVLAISQTNSPNFNHDKIASKDQLVSKVVEAAFEPGSILKPFVAAMAMEHELTHPDEMIDCERGKYRFGKHTINDVHGQGMISTHTIVVKSSNIGMTKLGVRMGKDLLYDSLRRFGFGERTGIRVPGEASGLLRRPKAWYPIDVATHSFGQGVAVTPLQVIRATAAVVNGGILPPLSLTINGGPVVGERIIRQEIAESTKVMMIGVVEEQGGTGSRARVPGIIVGGKTGTAQRPLENGRGYEKGAYIASFTGFADGSPIGVNRKLALVVVMDRPKGGSIYGGIVSAPVFQRIIHRSMYYLSTRESGNFNPGSEFNEGSSAGMFHHAALKR